MWLCFIYFTRIVEIIEVVMYYIHIDWLRCIIIPSIETILCTCIEMRLSISWARRDRPCWDGEMLRCNLGTWRSSVRKLFDIMIVRWDRPHRHVEIVRVGIWTSRVPHGSWTLDVFSRSIMYIRLSEYWVFWAISLHGIILHCISSHHSFLMTICFVWCLESIKCWFPLLMKLK